MDLYGTVGRSNQKLVQKIRVHSKNRQGLLLKGPLASAAIWGIMPSRALSGYGQIN